MSKSLFELVGKKEEPKPQAKPAMVFNIAKEEQSETAPAKNAPVKPAPLDAPEEFAHESQPDKFSDTDVDGVKDCLKLLADNINDRNIVGNAIYNLLHKLQTDEKFRGVLLDEDLGLMVRGLRESYGVAVAVKRERKATRTKKAVQQEDIGKLLADFEFIA